MHDANARKLAEYFSRVSIRVRNTGAFDYAVLLESFFDGLARSREYPGRPS